MTDQEPNQFDIGKEKIKTSVMIPVPMYRALELLAKRRNQTPTKEIIRLLELTLRELSKHDNDVKKIRDLNK
jgi:hypothetical protein